MFTDKNKAWVRVFALLIAGNLIFSACAPAPVPEVKTGATSLPTQPVLAGATSPPTQAVKATVAPPAVVQREVVIGMAADPTVLDPNISTNTTDSNIAANLFDPLVQKDPRDMSIVPMLAESWQVVDPKTYVFKLRQGVRFHDGTEVVASDVKFSSDRVKDPAIMGIAAPDLAVIKSVDVIDKYTVRFNLDYPYAPFLKRVPTLLIVPEHYVKSVGNAEFAKKPIGSGPYKFVEWVKDDHLTLVANEDYWKGAPQIKRVVFKPIPETSTRLAALRSGAADIVEQLNPENIPTVQQDKCCRVETTNGNKHYFFGINARVPPFNDVRIRQALAYATDWDSIMALFGDVAVRTAIPLLPEDFGYAEIAPQIKQYVIPYDPNKARALLAEAGYPNGFETTIQTPAGKYPKDVEVSQALSNQLAKVGIKTTVEPSPWSLYSATFATPGKVKGLAYWSFGNPVFDPDFLFSVHFDPDRTTSHLFETPELTDLIHRGAASVDTQERIKIYTQAFQILVRDSPYLWGFLTKQIYGVRADINWKARSDIRIFANEASFVK